MRRLRLFLGAAFFALSSAALPAGATEYFVDSENGDDASPGTAESSAFRTLAHLNGSAFEPGDFVRLKRGGRWDVTSLGSSGFTVMASGTRDAPITISSFGEGAAPVLVNGATTTPWVRAVSIHGAFVIVEDLHIEGAHESGIVLEKDGHDVVVRRVEIDGTGTGILVKTAGNRIEECFFHDLRMVSDTPGGDDDFGAVAVQLQASNNEVLGCRMERCKAPSQDYGVDGGAIEIYLEEGTELVENLSIHHNWASDGEGFFEIGGRGGTVRNVFLDHNVALDNRLLGVVHNGGTNFTIAIEGLTLTNNTIVESVGERAEMLFSPSPLDEGTLLFRNNVLVAGSGFSRVFSSGTFAHDHNLFELGEGVELGLELGETELSENPKFVDRESRDFHLTPESPAIDRGSGPGGDLDFDGKAVAEGVVDLGAYEYVPESLGAGSSIGPSPSSSGCSCSTTSYRGKSLFELAGPCLVALCFLLRRRRPFGRPIDER